MVDQCSAQMVFSSVCLHFYMALSCSCVSCAHVQKVNTNCSQSE